MTYHVELSEGLHRARVFNLNREDLMAKVVAPWLEDRIIEMGDREWKPQESILNILEGPTMETADLNFGQGWSNAERKSANVTRQVLEDAPAPHEPDAFAIETDSPQDVTAAVLAAHGGAAIQWGEARRRLDDRDPEVAAVILVVRRPGSAAPRS